MIETVEMVELELDLEVGWKMANVVMKSFVALDILRYTYGLYLKYYELYYLSLQYYGRNRHK